MKTSQKGLIAIGLALLAWWWWRGRGSTSESPANPLNGISDLLTSITAGRAASNPLTDFQSFLGLSEAAAGDNPSPPSDSWVWFGLTGKDKDKVVPLSEYALFDQKKCGPLGCSAYGRPCISGIDCKPGDPAYKG